MSGLHQACARAIASEHGCAHVRLRDQRAAAAAIGVCLAEAQRAVEALRPALNGNPLSDRDVVRDNELCRALAALAALAEQA